MGTHYGLYKGDAFLSWIKKRISFSKLGLNENSTFADLKENGGKDLYVFASDLYTKDIVEFSYRKTPDVIIAEAVRASMSIPMFFQAWRFSNNNPNDHLYVDGGVAYNYPLSTFDSNEFTNDPSNINKQTLGFHLDNITGGTTIKMDLI